jgi:hypothetical protein
LKELVRVRNVLRKNKEVSLPNFVDNSDVKILKVCMKTYMREMKGIPDPYLVVLRAGINWSALQDAKLLPTCNCAPVAEDESVCSISSIEEIICTLPCDDDCCSVLRDNDGSVMADSKPLAKPPTVTPDAMTGDSDSIFEAKQICEGGSGGVYHCSLWVRGAHTT